MKTYLKHQLPSLQFGSKFPSPDGPPIPEGAILRPILQQNVERGDFEDGTSDRVTGMSESGHLVAVEVDSRPVGYCSLGHARREQHEITR